MRKFSVLFFVLLVYGCAASSKDADPPKATATKAKPPPVKREKPIKNLMGKQIHTECRSCHSNPDKGKLYPFIKTKSDRVNPHTTKPFSRIEAICTSCHDFFHYIHPEVVPVKSDRVVLSENVRLDEGRINCLSCHDMHQKNPSYKNLYPTVSDKEQLKGFCLKCHSQAEKLKDDVYYTLTELRIMALKEHDIFLDESDDGWFYQGAGFIKRFYESVKGEKSSEEVRVEESFQIRKNTSIALDAISEGNLNRAIHLLWTAFRKDSDFAQGYTRFAKGFDSMGSPDVAEKFYLHALKLDRAYAPAYLGLGRIFFQQEKYWEAINQFSKAVRYDPGMKEAYYKMGNCYLEVKNYTEGIRVFREAVNLDPKNLDGYLKLAHIYQITNDYLNAIRILDEALVFYPEHFEIHFRLGNAYYASSDMDRAMSSYEKSLKIEPDNYEANIRLGKTYEMIQDTKKAIRNYENAVMSDKYSIEGHLNLARLYRSINDFTKAEKATRAALQIRPGSVEARMALGDTYYQNKNYAQAEQEYKKALLHNPFNKEANLHLGVLYHQSGRDDMAIAILQKMVEGKSTQPNVYLLLGECLRDNPDEAARIYRQGIRYSTHKAVLYFNLAYLYRKVLDRPDLARKTYEEAIADYPAYAMAYFYMGSLLKEENDMPQASRFLEKAIQLDPNRMDAYLLLAEMDKEKYSDNARDKMFSQDIADFKDTSYAPFAEYELLDTEEREKFYYKLGTIYLANGKWENAVETFNRVLILNPTHPQALSNIVVAYRALSQLDKALQMLTQLSDLHPEIPGIYIEIGNIHKYMGQKKLAFKNYLKAQDLVPGGLTGKSAEILKKFKVNKKELLAQGDTHLQEQEYFRAEQKYKAVLSLEPGHPDASLRLWRLYNNSNRADKAEAILREMVEGKSNRAEFYLLLGERQNGPDEAIDIYREGIRNCKNKAVLYFNIGYLYWKMPDGIDSAREAYKMAIVSYPAYAKAYLYLGRILKNNIPQAIRYLEKAIELDPSRIDAYFLLAGMGKEEYYARLFDGIMLADFSEISQVPNAKYELDLKDGKQKEEFYYKLGTIYMANGNWENAAESFKRVLKWNPDHPGVMSKIGIAYKAQGNFKKALKTLFNLLGAHPEDPKIFFEIGNIYKEMGQADSAQEYYLKARAFTPEDTMMMAQLELALADISYDIWFKSKGMDLLVKTKNYHEKALTIYPEYQNFRRRLEEVKKMINGQIQIFMVKTRSERKYKEIVKQIRQKSLLADLRRIAGKYPQLTQISYVHPRDLDSKLKSALDELTDGEISPVIQIKRKQIGIYRIISADGGKNR